METLNVATRTGDGGDVRAQAINAIANHHRPTWTPRLTP
jgi:hypothetical protein